VACIPLSPTARRVQDELVRLGSSCTVVEYAEPTRTAQEAAVRAGCTLGQITKSLVFRGVTTGKPVLVLTSGANRVDEGWIGEYAGEPIARADADFVRVVTGFAIGGVPPIGHSRSMETYLDEDLLGFDSIWAAAGTPNAIFELTPGELKRITGGRVVSVKRPRP
jgi:prolyl-tRNA editing enzyme YbaK/EbsC (Cys-tRNA(Pro) deacylase)